MSASPSYPPELSLADLGWDPDWAARLAASAPSGSRPARVSRSDRSACDVLAPEPLRVLTAGQPAVTGDWVAVGPGPLPADPPVVTHVLPRRSAFVRHHPGLATAEQVVAANMDTVFVVNGLDTALSARRLERYLTLGWQSGAIPVVVLTKSDCRTDDDVTDCVEQARAVAPGVEVLAISSASGAGVDSLAGTHLAPGRTVALLGPSGSGKSTLVNRLAGSVVMATGDTRRDGKGRHTTTHRQLLVLPGLGVLVDTPGMRGLGLWDADEGLSMTFSDVEELIGGCRFSDCRHVEEPGCAVLAAIDDGSLSRARLASWHNLQRELRALAARQGDRTARQEKLRQWKSIAKANRHRDRRRDR